MRFAALLFLAAALLVSHTAEAQTLEDYDYENLDFRGVGLDVGYVFPSRVESTLSLGIRADFGYLGPDVRIVPGISFWSSQLRQSEIQRLENQINEFCRETQGGSCLSSDAFEDVSIDLSDLIINVDALYEFTNPYITTPYLGVGGGVHLLNGSGEFINDTFIEDLLDAITPGINLIGGVNVSMSDRLQLFGEARYVLVSDVRHGAINLGGMWTLGPPRPGARPMPPAP